MKLFPYAFRFAKTFNRWRGFAAPSYFLIPWLFYFCISAAHATAAAASEVSASYASMLQVMVGLVLVLAVIAGSAWLLRRFSGTQRITAGTLRVIGGLAVGQRERVVLVEVADTWLVIGVAPGRVTALHSMPKGEIPAADDHLPTHAAFPGWPRPSMEKRNGEQRDK